MKLQDKLDKVQKFVEEQHITAAMDNVMGLTYLNAMVDVAVQTPELQEYLHKVIEGLIGEMANYEIPDENEEFMKDYM